MIYDKHFRLIFQEVALFQFLLLTSINFSALDANLHLGEELKGEAPGMYSSPKKNHVATDQKINLDKCIGSEIFKFFQGKAILKCASIFFPVLRSFWRLEGFSDLAPHSAVQPDFFFHFQKNSVFKVTDKVQIHILRMYVSLASSRAILINASVYPFHTSGISSSDVGFRSLDGRYVMKYHQQPRVRRVKNTVITIYIQK
jgi:hypothetical protein